MQEPAKGVQGPDSALQQRIKKEPTFETSGSGALSPNTGSLVRRDNISEVVGISGSCAIFFHQSTPEHRPSINEGESCLAEQATSWLE